MPKKSKDTYVSEDSKKSSKKDKKKKGKKKGKEENYGAVGTERRDSASSASSGEYRLVETKKGSSRPLQNPGRVSALQNYEHEPDYGPLTLYNRLKRYERVLNEETEQILGLNYEIQSPELVNTSALNARLMQVREEVRRFSRSNNQIILLEHALLQAETDLRNRGRANIADTVNAIHDFNQTSQRLVVNLKCHIAECVRWMDRQAAFTYDEYSEIYKCVRNDLVNYHEAVDDEYKALKYFLDEFLSRVTRSGSANTQGPSHEFSGGAQGTMTRSYAKPYVAGNEWDQRVSMATTTHEGSKSKKKSK